jgi:OPA family sugar phosphate sensor protein UhpC-like MFS transporter
VLSSAGSIASTAVPPLAIFVTSIANWQLTYYAFGVCSILVGVLVCFTVKDRPEDIGVVSNAAKRQEHKNSSQEDRNAKGSVRKWYDVFFIPDLWVVSTIYAILYFAFGSCFYWSRVFFEQEGEMSQAQATACTSMFPVGALIGNISVGYLSDLLILPVSNIIVCRPV